MGKYKKYKNSVERFLSGENGQRFFNFAYSIGAAIVILGALFKILHLPGGNTLLTLGMGTEVVMFILTAFDRPAKEYKWEDVFPVLETKAPEDKPTFGAGGGGGIVIAGGASGVEMADGVEMVGGTAISGGGTVGGGGTFYQSGVNLSESDSASLSDSISKMAAASEQLSQMAELTDATQQYLTQISGITQQMEQLKTTTESLNQVSSTLLGSYQAITDNSGTISDSSTGYAEQMSSLNRNIMGLNTIYEIQLKSISSQLDNIDRVNRGLKDIRDMYEKSAVESVRFSEETERMSLYMKQLNNVYDKMLRSMSANMYRPMGGSDELNDK